MMMTGRAVSMKIQEKIALIERLWMQKVFYSMVME